MPFLPQISLVMRIQHLNPDDCRRYYTDAKKRVEEFEFRNQTSWFFQAHSLVQLAKIAYAIGHPFSESRSCLRQATEAFRELFALRGTTFSRRIRYKGGKPLPEETISGDGYSSVDSFDAALTALTIRDFDLARDLVTLAGPSPNASVVSPRSEVCTTNQQTLSHALNSLLASDRALARHEASKLAVRTATKIEKQIGLMIAAIATGGDVLTERGALLDYHEQLAVRRDNHLDSSFWLCMPALGLSFLSIHFGEFEFSDLETDSVYCPIGLLAGSEAAD